MLDEEERAQLYGRLSLATFLVFLLSVVLLAGAPAAVYFAGIGLTGVIALVHLVLWLWTRFRGGEPDGPPHPAT